MRKFYLLLVSLTFWSYLLLEGNPSRPTNEYEISSSVDIESLNPLKDNDNILTLVLMVKDEEPVIVPTLKTYIESGINYVLLFDTGSTDKTVELAKEYLEATNTNYVIKQEPFINFAASRNRALSLAEEYFPNNKFMLMPDAEWYLHGGQELLKFCRDHLDDNGSCYLVKITNPGIDFGMPRLIRAYHDVKFIGRCHEVPSRGATISVPADTYFELSPSQFGLEKSKKRWSRDRDLLVEDFMEDPSNTRTAFYLAQTHHCLENYKEAYKYYKYRSKMVGWPEEDFMTFYRLGQVCEMLKNDNGEDNWPEALHYYLEAYSMRPNRVEPLIKIARHYVKDRFPLAQLFSRKACDTPYPAHDVLFIDKHLYDYDRHEVLSLCSWYLGEFEEGKRETLEAMKVYPDAAHLKRNLELYSGKLNESNIAVGA